MKKIIYLMAIMAVFFTSCEPMEDIYDEIDQQGSEDISGDAAFIMDADDYKATGDNDVKDNETFIDIAQAETLIPVVLANKYPVWGKTSSAVVSFNLDRLNVIAKTIPYEVADEDYDALGFKFGNFDSDDDFIAFLLYKYPDAMRGDLINLTYQWWAPGAETRTDKFLYTDEWVKTDQFSSDDYNAMGQRFSNFSNFNTAEFRIGVYLGTLAENTFAQSEDSKMILYTYTYKDEEKVRQFVDAIASYTFDGSKWNINLNTIKFGHNGTAWAPDNTIKYTLTAADYELVGNGRYGNFDVRPGNDEETEAARLAKINTILLNNFPSNAEGQQYIVSYSIYNGSAGVWTMSVILEGGEYVLNN